MLPRGYKAAETGVKSTMGLMPVIRGVSTLAASAALRGGHSPAFSVFQQVITLIP